MQKPPLAPKPKLIEPWRPGLSPPTTRTNGLPHPSLSTPKMVKPALAPKPCLSKRSTASESIPLSTKSLHQISVSEKSELPRTQGLLNSRNGIQQENKKPDWDYVIPICLCSQENCQCTGNTTDKVIDKIENDLKTYKGETEDFRKPVHRSRGTPDNRGEKMDTTKCQVMNSKLLPDVCVQVASTYDYLSNHKPFHQTLAQNKLAETSDLNLSPGVDMTSSVVTARPSLPPRTWSDEINGNITCSSAIEQEAEEDSIGSNHMYGEANSDRTSVPAAPRKPLPVPVPRKPRKATSTRQEKEEEEREGREPREMSVKEVVSTERKSWPSASINAPVPAQNAPVGKSGQPLALPSRKPCPPPAPPPKKKPFLSTPDRTLTAAAITHHLLPPNVELRWDDGVYEMECSVDEEVGKVKEGRDEQEADYSKLTRFPPSTSLRSQPELSCRSALAMATSGRSEEDGAGKIAPMKPQRHSAPIAWMLKKEASEERKSTENEKGQELLLPPGEKATKSFIPTLVSPGSRKPLRSSLGKQRAKSFSSADITHSEGPKRHSFRKLLDLKLSVKMLPKLIAKGGQTLDCTIAETEQCVDSDQERLQDFHERLGVRTWGDRKFSCPQIGLEQCVDGDEFHPSMEQAVDYENVPHYEEIPDYMNLSVGSAVTSTQAQQHAWQNLMYGDENIYEEQEPYMPLEKHSGHRQKDSNSER